MTDINQKEQKCKHNVYIQNCALCNIKTDKQILHREFNLSEHIDINNSMDVDSISIQLPYIKEFIKRLKEELPDNPDKRNEFIDKLSGKNLI